MNDLAASGRGTLQRFLFKTRGEPRRIKPTCGIQNFNTRALTLKRNLQGWGKPFPHF